MSENIEFVEKYYKMDPETERLIPVTSDLVEGMTVLFGSSSRRMSSIEISEHDWAYDRAMEYNRWCTVSRITFDEKREQYTFLASYEDGTQRMRTVPSSAYWFVKKDSFTKADQLAKRRLEVMNLVAKAMLKQNTATYHGVTTGMDKVGLEITDEIMRLFS